AASFNKQFKSDFPHLAFLVWVKFSVYGVQVECCGRVAHTLTGRYCARFAYQATHLLHTKKNQSAIPTNIPL
ncbi:hypothetical protein AB4376_04935, partial [Vibrio breoganii]